MTQLQRLAGQIEAAKLEARGLTADLGDAQLWQRPPGGGWSVGECLAHLNTVGALYLAQLKPALAQAKADGLTGRGPFRLGLIGGFFVWSMEPPVRVRTKTFKIFAPEPQEGVTEAFVALQDALLDFTVRAEGVDVGRVRVASPESQLLRLSAYEALCAVLAHQRRHLWQAARVKGALGGA